MIDFRHSMLEDIFHHNRPFLPGDRCRNKEEVIKHFGFPILLDGLSAEESALILSTLPRNADRIFLSPLDKGLSGSKVFAAKYDIGGKRQSKRFVVKVGPLKKIQKEYEAIQTFAEPLIRGVGQPILRLGADVGLVAQELSGLSTKGSNLQSLRYFARHSRQAGPLIHRLFNERLENFYFHQEDSEVETFSLKTLFEWYLRKVGKNLDYPASWRELRNWVRDLTKCRWFRVDETVGLIVSQEIRSISTVVHGDLHSQNILIDERQECWPIDFAWCHDGASPVLDAAMLECSLKFLSIPGKCALRTLIQIEKRLSEEPLPKIRLTKVPYREEIENVLGAIYEVRRFAMDKMGIVFADYLKSLCLMTYTLTNHPQLNRPLVLSSLQILTAMERAR